MTGPDLAGTARLVHFGVRRDRIRIVVWILSIVGLVALTAAGVKGLFPTQADLDAAARASQDNAAALAFNGPAQGLDTYGGQVAFQVGAFGLVLVALMAVFMTARLTRGEEETGRLELVRALPVGRDAPMAAGLIVVGGMNALVGLLVTLSLSAQDLPLPGSAVFGASFGLLGLTFSAVAVLAAQVTENTRVVSGLAGAVLGLSFALRAAGDVGDGTLAWFSPIGWAQKTRPFAGERWWPLLLLATTTVALASTARTLAARRDVGGALVAPRPGPATAAPALRHPLGLAVRLHRSALAAWTAGLVLTGVAYGSIADSVDDFVADNEALSEMLARVEGVDLTDAYLATSFRILAVIAGGFAVAAVLRARAEESAGRAEPILATPVTRSAWMTSHLVTAAAGSGVILAGAGLATGVSYGAIGGGMARAPGLAAAALAYLPAVWLMAGLAAALIGFVPRASGAAWAGLGFCLVVGMLADLLALPAWVVGLSPFEHVPLVPADGFSGLPLLALTALAAALAAAGLSGLARRDIG